MSVNNSNIHHLKNYTDSEQSLLKELYSAQSCAVNAIEHGKHSIETLHHQDEVLDNVEDTLDSNENILMRSMTVLRGMTWSGYLYNTVTDAADYIVSVANNSNNNNEKPISNKCAAAAAVLSCSDSYKPNTAIINNDNNNKTDYSSNNQCNSTDYARNTNHVDEKKELMMNQSNRQPIRTTVKHQSELLSPEYYNEEQKQLTQISASIDTLHQMSIAMNEQLDNQNATLERIDTKSDQVSDRTLAVTLKASQLNDRTRRKTPKLLGTYNFIDLDTGYFLSVNSANELVLSPLPTDEVNFKCYVRESNIIGIQNEKSLKYVGCSVLGNVIVSSDYFGKYEECYIDFTGSTSNRSSFPMSRTQCSRQRATSLASNTNRTGICFLARNWGSGGWLKANVSTRTTGTVSSIDATVSNQSNYSNYIGSWNGHNDDTIRLTSTTSSIGDKIGIIQFKAIEKL